MNFVTIYYIWLKCYINLFNIVPAKMGSCRQFTVIALALNHLYYFLFTVQTSSLFSTDNIQDNLSLSDSSNACTISTGTVVRRDFECAVCKFTVDSNSNNFISPFMLFFINIFDNVL